MGILDYILLTVIGAGIVLAIASILKKKKHGGCAGCSGNCGQCGKGKTEK